MEARTVQPGTASRELVDRNAITTVRWAGIGLVLLVAVTSLLPIVLWRVVGSGAAAVGAVLPVVVLLGGGYRFVRHARDLRRFDTARLTCDRYPLALGGRHVARLVRARHDGGVPDYGQVRASLRCVESAGRRVNADAGPDTRSDECVVLRQDCPVDVSDPSRGVAIELEIPVSAPPTMSLGLSKISWELEVETAVKRQPLRFALDVGAGVAGS